MEVTIPLKTGSPFGQGYLRFSKACCRSVTIPLKTGSPFGRENGLGRRALVEVTIPLKTGSPFGPCFHFFILIFNK